MTITRAFCLTINTQTGAVERWAAGDPASVVEHLASRSVDPQEHWCELCGDSLTTLRHDAAIGWHRNCSQCGSEYQGAAERAMTRKPCRCGPDGCSVSDCAGKA